MYVSCMCDVCLECCIGDIGGQMLKCLAGCSSWPKNVGGVKASDDCELYVGSVIDDGVGVGGTAGSAHLVELVRVR